MTGYIIAMLFGFICGSVTTVLQYNRNEQIKIKIKEEIDRLHK